MHTVKKFTFTATVEFIVYEPFIDELDTTQIVGELVKIKSGEYENMFYGDITEIGPIHTEEIETDEFDDLFEELEDEDDPEETVKVP